MIAKGWIREVRHAVLLMLLIRGHLYVSFLFLFVLVFVFLFVFMFVFVLVFVFAFDKG